MTVPGEKDKNWAAFAGATIFDRRLWVALAIALIAGFALWFFYLRAPPPPPVAPPAGPSAELLARLSRGVNLSNWLQHGPPSEPARHALDADDFRRIRALGLTHVRLPVDPAALVDDRGLPKAAAVAALREAIEGALREDLLVVLALQLPSAQKSALVAHATNRVALAGLWRWLAGTLRDLPPAQLAFEPLNEPEIADAPASRALLAELAAELRAVAPKHTLIVSGHRYSAIADLVELQPLADANVVYGFHFYEPHNFTHQGADWGDPAWRLLRNFPYPSSPEAVAPRLGSVAPEARELLRWHGEERWNRARIGASIERAVQWRQRHGVKVWCSEFGVLKERVAAADRAAWLGDVRVALEERGIPWTHWDYAGPFGLVSGTRGKRVEDATAIEALGLKRE